MTHTVLHKAEIALALDRIIPAQFAEDGSLMGAVVLVLRRYGGLQDRP